MMTHKSPRVAVRGILIVKGRMLLVNAWADAQKTLLCAPGGGVMVGTSLPENLKREFYEETGIEIIVESPCLVNEFHDEKSEFHQTEIFFRCNLKNGTQIPEGWIDTEAIVTRHVWATPEEMKTLEIKPDSLAAVAFAPETGISYDPLEQIAD